MRSLVRSRKGRKTKGCFHARKRKVVREKKEETEERIEQRDLEAGIYIYFTSWPAGTGNESTRAGQQQWRRKGGR